MGNKLWFQKKMPLNETLCLFSSAFSEPPNPITVFFFSFSLPWDYYAFGSLGNLELLPIMQLLDKLSCAKKPITIGHMLYDSIHMLHLYSGPIGHSSLVFVSSLISPLLLNFGSFYWDVVKLNSSFPNLVQSVKCQQKHSLFLLWYFSSLVLLFYFVSEKTHKNVSPLPEQSPWGVFLSELSTVSLQ